MAHSIHKLSGQAGQLCPLTRNFATLCVSPYKKGAPGCGYGDLTRRNLSNDGNGNENVTRKYTYLPTLPVLAGVSKFFIKSPGLPVRPPNLPVKSYRALFFHKCGSLRCWRYCRFAFSKVLDNGEAARRMGRGT